MANNRMYDEITIEAPTIDVTYIENLLKEKPSFDISHIFKHITTQNTTGYGLRTTLARYAVETNDEKLLDYLINKNVDLNVKHSFDSILAIAVKKGAVKLVEKLHKAGVSVNARWSEHYATPLIQAVIQGNFEIAKYLIHNGADVNAQSICSMKWGHTAVLIAISQGYNDIAELLLQNNAEPCAEIDSSSLNEAAVENLLSTTPNVNINSFFVVKKPVKYHPATLAHLAVRSKNEELLNYLLTLKADLNISIPYHGTVLHEAVRIEDLDLVKKLCDFGADVNVPSYDEWTQTPLCVAAEENSFEIAKYLLERGANLNTRMNNYRSYRFNPLRVAIRKGHKDIVELLLKNNADPNAKMGITSTTTFACTSENLDIIKMLVAYGGTYDNSALRRATWHKTSRVLDYLLTLDVNEMENYLTAGKSEISILHYTLNNLQSFITLNYHIPQGSLKVILDAGVNINCVDDNNQLAVEFKNTPQSLDYIKQHIIKLKQAGIYVCQKNIEAVKKGYESFYSECDQEIIKLKSDKVGTSNQAFFGVLHKNFQFLAIRLRHTSIDTIVDKTKLLTEYPIYGGIIYYKLAKVQRRIALLKNVEEFLDFILNYCLKLPYTFTRELYMYLCNEDLNKLK